MPNNMLKSDKDVFKQHLHYVIIFKFHYFDLPQNCTIILQLKKTTFVWMILSNQSVTLQHTNHMSMIFFPVDVEQLRIIKYEQKTLSTKLNST